MSDEIPLETPELSEELAKKLDVASGDKKIRYLRFQAKETVDYLNNQLRPAVKDVKNFWPLTLLAHVVIKQACSLKSDIEALSYLVDVELKHDEADPRPYELIFTFKENPFFSNQTLSKKYSLAKGTDAAPSDGSITDQMREFDLETLVPSSTTIDWKDDLCKKYPRKKTDPNAEEFEGDSGSFFHYFTDASDPYTLGAILQTDILPDAYEYFLGEGENCGAGYDSDDDDELDEEDGDDDEEIDLEEVEKRQPKKQRTQ